jgi:hypothetical protein
MFDHLALHILLIDEQIRLETHLTNLAGNQSPMVSKFVRKFVKSIESRRPPEQLLLRSGDWSCREREAGCANLFLIPSSAMRYGSLAQCDCRR